ncbi:hypothetical protein AO366_1190 [Moraxella catarrhalis]|nr:hypothetical protein AO366_1190 [Moraxella catarrhalis]
MTICPNLDTKIHTIIQVVSGNKKLRTLSLDDNSLCIYVFYHKQILL